MHYLDNTARDPFIRTVRRRNDGLPEDRNGSNIHSYSVGEGPSDIDSNLDFSIHFR
jgi:hypothetical protein